MIRFFSLLTLALFPQLSWAQPANFRDFVHVIINIVQSIVPAIMAMMFIVIVWGVLKGWIINVGDETARRNGKNIAVAGVIGFVLLTSIWGVVGIIRTSLFG